MEDPEINEIMVNGRDHIFVERKGELFRIDEAFHRQMKHWRKS